MVSDLVDMAGGGPTVTVAEALLVVSATEVAVTVTLSWPVTVPGALYVAPVLAVLLKVPHSAPEAPSADRLQVTPWELESLSTLAT